VDDSTYLIRFLFYVLFLSLITVGGLATIIAIGVLAGKVLRLMDQQRRRWEVRTLAQIGAPQATAALEKAVVTSSDEQVHRIALDGLQRFAAQGRVKAQEALCRLMVEHGHPLACQIVLAAQYLPRDEHLRTLFYFLTGQWEAYESLDFDQSLLKAAYEAADEGLRGQIVAGVRKAGRAEWVGVIAVGRRGQRLKEMTDGEWEAALAVLEEEEGWAAMWRLAQAAPAVWSLRLLRRLNQTGWRPREGVEREGFAELVQLTEGCGGEIPRLEALRRGQVVLRGDKDLLGRPRHPIRSLAISPDGRLLASGSGDQAVRLWSLPDGTALKTRRAPVVRVSADCLAFSPDGRMLAGSGALPSGEQINRIRLWQMPDGKVLKTLFEHRDAIECLAFSPHGQVLASGSRDTTIRLWHLSTWFVVKILPDPNYFQVDTLQGHTGAVRCLAIGPDRRLLVSGGGPGDGTVRLWCLPHGTPLSVLEGHTSEVTCLAISPSGSLLASGSGDTTVRLWRLPGRVALKTLQSWRPPDWAAPKALEGHIGRISSLAISPNGQVLASGSLDGTVRLWRLPDGAALETLRGHEGGVHCLAVSPDGRVLASGGEDNAVRLWRLPDGTALKALEGHTGAVRCLAVGPHEPVLASGGDDGQVRLWEMGPSLLGGLPVGQTSPADLEWVQETLQQAMRKGTKRMNDARWRWLEFMLALMRWHRRFDVEVVEAPAHVPAEEFDIEIEG
jgi:WD40 repeat protein